MIALSHGTPLFHLLHPFFHQKERVRSEGLCTPHNRPPAPPPPEQPGDCQDLGRNRLPMLGRIRLRLWDSSVAGATASTMHITAQYCATTTKCWCPLIFVASVTRDF